MSICCGPQFFLYEHNIYLIPFPNITWNNKLIDDTTTKHYQLTDDNSGVRCVRCIRVLGSSYKKWASYGDLIKASVINVLSKSKIKDKLSTLLSFVVIEHLKEI